MLNDKIIEVFEDIADQHGLSDVAKKQITDLLHNLASGKGTKSEKNVRINNILTKIAKDTSIAEDNNGD